MNRFKKLLSVVFILLSVFLFHESIYAQEPPGKMKEWSNSEFQKWYKDFMKRRGSNFNAFGKPTAGVDRKADGVMDGNRLRTLFTNFGSIGQPRRAPALEWPIYSGVSYGYEFGVVVGAEVVSINGDTIHILDDALIDGGERANPRLNTGNVMGWEPLPGYAAVKPNESAAKSSDVSTWPPEWEKWPGLMGEGIISGDVESYWIMDDRFNDEFEYYPVESDKNIRGLGLEIKCRLLQYSAQVAEDIIFALYELTLREDAKGLTKVVVGMVGDPHVGGGADYQDDYAGFDREANLVYAWDNPGSSNDYNLPQVGYLGFMFLESPSNYTDGIDNDGDGIVDESRFNGIDDDGDWDATDAEALADPDDSDGLSDDLGSDGIAGTNDPDGTEGNGIPDIGEPDFEWNDIDESDEIGLTSMSAPIYGTVTGAMDERMWRQLTPENFTNIQQNSDNLFIFGSGYFPLQPGETQRFSLAIIVGEDEQDMRANAAVAKQIYRRNFQFTKAPEKPIVIAVPGDQRVTIYWDNKAEDSVDPLLGRDFEGYSIYRSEDKGVTWGKPITDNRGIQTYWEPLARYDLVDEITGPHELGVNGLHFYMGDDSGIRHAFVDSNVSNGITYYYAVSSYDKGSTTFGSGIVPVECSRVIGDINVVEVKPNAPSAGYVESSIDVSHPEGLSNARVIVEVLDPAAMYGHTFHLSFTVVSQNKKLLIYQHDKSDPILSNYSFENGTPFVFEGVKLTLFDWTNLDLYADESGWIDNTSNYTFTLGVQGTKNPADYEIRFFDTDVSTAINNIPVPFEVWNVTTNTKLDFGLNDSDGSGTWTATKGKPDFIAIREEVNGSQTFTWKITITESDTVFSSSDPTIVVELPAPPSNGSVLKIATTREFTENDVYELTPTLPKIDNAKTQSDLDKIAVVPNPYVVAASWENPTEFRTGRGERRIDFIHLPRTCTIRIYTMSGDLVQILEHFGTMLDGTKSWNLLSMDRMDISFGVYIFHVEAPGIGNKIGKFAIIK